MRYAGFWIRTLAGFLDVLILGVPALVLAGFFDLADFSSLAYLPSIGVVVLTIWFDSRGGTPGQWICGIRIVDREKKVIGVPAAVLRYVGTVVSASLLGIGYLMIAFTEKKQALHDIIAESYVVWD